MALEEYVGSIVLEIDGDEIDCVSVSTTRTTGRKVVKTMNRHQRAKGIAKTVKDYSLRVTAVVPKNKRIDWDAIEGAKITLEDDDGNRQSYLDCATVSVGDQYDSENEAKIDLEMIALDFVRE